MVLSRMTSEDVHVSVGSVASGTAAPGRAGFVSAGDLAVSAERRAALLGHRSAILWFTGLPAAGKSTLAAGLERELFRAGILPVVLDGDGLRTGLSRGLSFSTADRIEAMRRAAEAALLLANGGAVVIVALISPFREVRRQIAAQAKDQGIAFAEIYVNAPVAVCEKRDPKSLYRRARAGELHALTGVDAPYEAPEHPHLELRTDQETVAESLAKLLPFALSLARPDRTAPPGNAGDL